MPRCSECGQKHRSNKAIEQHWNKQHPEKLEKRQNKPSTAGRKLIITNLITYWKKQVNASASPLQHS